MPTFTPKCLNMFDFLEMDPDYSGYCQISVQDAAVTSWRCSKTARRLTPPEALCNINLKMSILSSRTCGHQTPMSPSNQELNPVNRAVWGSTSEDNLSLQKFQVCARTTVWVKKNPPPLRTCGNISKTAWNFSTKFHAPIMHSYLR